MNEKKLTATNRRPVANNQNSQTDGSGVAQALCIDLQEALKE